MAIQVNQQNQIGAVSVVEGGIAAIRAALDLAVSVTYMVKESPAIGGVTSDKDFPTNNCSINSRRGRYER
jgi:heterodisulfide reductase subunit A-like polyferredoxin